MKFLSKMRDHLHLRGGWIIASVFVTYLLAFIMARVAKQEAVAGAVNTIFQTLLDCSIALFCLSVARRAEPGFSGFYRLLSASFFSSAVMCLTYGFLVNIFVIQPETTAGALIYMLPYTVFLLLWIFAWVYEIIRSWRYVFTGSWTSHVATILVVALGIVFYLYYRKSLLKPVEEVQGVFHPIFTVLEMLSVTIALVAVLLARSVGIRIFAVGFSLLIATDFVLCVKEINQTIVQNESWEIVWSTAQAIILCGAILISRSIDQDNKTHKGPAIQSSSSALGASIALMIVGVVLVLSLTELLLETRESKVFVLITASSIGLGIVASILRVNDRARSHVLKLLSEDVDAVDVQDKKDILKFAGLYSLTLKVLTRFRGIIEANVPIGPERVFRITRFKKDRLICFVIMPYEASWSHDVYDGIRRACDIFNVECKRQDEDLTNQDVLQGIWDDISRATFVIADITNQTPNVMYEVGLSHAIAKPMLLLSQSIDDTPFDVRTRRVLRYSPKEIEKLKKNIGRFVGDILTKYSGDDLASNRATQADRSSSGR